GDTLVHGSIEEFIIYGGNFDTAATVLLTRGSRGIPDPGNITGKIKTITSNLIIADFDLTSYDIIGDWDLVVQNPDSSAARDTLFFIPSLIFAGAELTGTVGFPVVPFGLERSNYLQIFNFGNDDGVLLFEITPPASEYINLKLESRILPEYDRSQAADKTKVYALISLGEKQQKALHLFWAVDPDKVVYPPSYGAFKTSAEKQRSEGDDELVFGSDKQVSYKGLKGATKAQMKGLLIGSMVTAGCGALTDALLQDPGLTNLKKAVDNVVDGLPSGIAKTPQWVAEQVANELLNLIPGVGWAQIIGGCINQIVAGFFNAWESAAKGAADRLRASTGGDSQRAFHKALDQMEKNGRLNLYSAQALYQVNAALQKPPCNPPPAFDFSSIGPIRGPFDPNDKTSGGNFVNGIELRNGDTAMIHMIPSSALADTIRYTIFFENKAQATDSAFTVTITDTLDAAWDVSTLQMDSALSLFSRGTFNWWLSGRVLTIQYDSIMLPPNVVPPEGEWQASFTMKLLPGLAAGTRIKNRAKIVFDFNPPIFTPEVIHIVGSPEISATAAAIDFGTLPVGSATTEQVWLKNTGAYELVIGGNALLTSSFEVASDPCSQGVLQPGDSCRMVLRFTPSFPGNMTDTLEIESSDISRFPFRIALKGDAVTGIGEAEKINIRIYPNPATGELNIAFGQSQRYDLRITGFIGTEIFKASVTGYSAKVDLKNFLPGVYFLSVTDEKGSSAVRKVVKM
ncbi:MAG TPA: choice-of-anchor D domain-containing protein, partial [Chitinophagales bacterium]|nr:choice-of-anchor D domain-containing protein [Chitinophagales bacterium]